MATKKSYKNDVIRASGLLLAVLIFFGGPLLIQTDSHKDRKELLQNVGRSRAIPNQLKLEIIEQLSNDGDYIARHSDSVSILGVTTTSTNWLAVLVILVTFGLPILTKYLENKKAA